MNSLVLGQVKTQIVSNIALPKNISYQGKPVQAIQYEDRSGTYLALAAQTGIQPQKGTDGNRQAHLYAYVFRLQGATAGSPLWQLHDRVTDCPLDLTAGFVPGSLAVTDLDKNGQAEVWTVYRISCQGDISPSELKIIMHEGTAKYAMRGTGKIKVGNTLQPDGGTIATDDFKRGPAAFRQYAGRLWDKYLLEVMK